MEENGRQVTRFRWRFAKNLENGLAIDSQGNTEFARDVTADGIIKQEGAIQSLQNCVLVGADSASLMVYSDGYSYTHVAGSISVLASDVQTAVQINGLPVLHGVGGNIEFPATNSNGGAGFVSCTLSADQLEIKVNPGAARTIFINVMFGPKMLEI